MKVTGGFGDGDSRVLCLYFSCEICNLGVYGSFILTLLV
jgi:hypothetical protein